jgi:dihydroorotate dehydrogenase (fumarate)
MTRLFKIGGVTFSTAPIMIGAGACKTPATTLDWLKVAPVVSGSYTPGFRIGNEGDRLFYPDDLETLLREGKAYNWLGMPNIGILSMRKFFAGITPTQPLIISIAAFTVADYLKAIRLVAKLKNIAAIELNFGCRNTEHGAPLSFDVHGLRYLLEQLPDIGIPIWCKFSPYIEETSFLLPEAAKLINQHPTKVAAVVTCNTKWEYAGQDKISSPDGYASLSGPALKPIALEQVKHFRHILVPEIDVIGVGGITTGNDVIDFLRAGAAAVQLTSVPFWLGNPGKFWEHLLEEEAGHKLLNFVS